MGLLLRKSPKKDNGIIKVIKKEGTGVAKPTAGTTVKVHYVGTLENGEKFDSSRDRNSEFEFLLGKDQVIKGWDIGVATMRQGEIAEFTIASEYGYGSTGSPPKIPGGATLIFEVELISWQAEDISPERDGSICRTIIVEGEKLANPNDTSVVEAHIVGTHDGRVFFDKDLSFILGEGSEVGLPEGVDRAMRRFCRGEKSIIDLKGRHQTYGSSPPAEYELPADAPLQFTIFLKNYEKVPATWEMTTAQKLAGAKEAKERGTAFLQQNKLKLALNKYTRVKEILEFENSLDPEDKKERDALILAAYLNMSLTCSKLGDQMSCVKYCDKALEVSPNHVKAMFRKAGAKFALSDVEEALAIYQKIVELEKDNKAAQQQILVCRQKIKDVEDADKRRFKKMFSTLTAAEKMDAEDIQPSTSTATN